MLVTHDADHVAAAVKDLAGAGLPVIENLQNLIKAGDKLRAFDGVLSGSLSFIFGKLDEGMAFSDATKIARSNGFTEPDPRDDLNGMDVARKLLILAREAGMSYLPCAFVTDFDCWDTSRPSVRASGCSLRCSAAAG